MGNAVPWEGRGNQEGESLGKSDRPELLAMEDRLGRKVKDKLFPEQLSSTCCTVSVRQGWPGARGSPPRVHYLCSSPRVQQTVLRRWHHTQHKMEACRTRHCFNLPLKAPSYCPFSPQRATPKKVSLFPPILISVQVRRKHFIKALTGLWCWASALLPFPFPVEPATLLEGSNLLPRREPSTEQHRNNQEGIPGAAHIAGFTPKFSQICGSSTGKSERNVPMPKLTSVTLTSFSFQLETWGKRLLSFHLKKIIGHWFQTISMPYSQGDTFVKQTLILCSHSVCLPFPSDPSLEIPTSDLRV